LRTSIAALVANVTLASLAVAAPFPKGDAAAGSKLYDEAKCNACHAKRFGGDGSSAYTRPDHKVKSADGLIKQVRACVTQLNVQWFPDEEEHVAAFLNQKFYKFK
jgi:mono/diheme cytochrome c family protein